MATGSLTRGRSRPGGELRKSEVSTKGRRHASVRNVLGLTRRQETVSVAELAQATRLSKTTVKKTLDLLASARLVVSAGKGTSTEEGGKPPELYRFNRTYGYVISAHVTPDALIAVTTDLHGDITYYRKTSIGTERELASILARIAADIRSFHALKASTGEKLIAIAVALPGLADSAHGVSIYSPHYPSWGRDVPFAQLLRDQLGPGIDVPAFVENVNRWQALAERDKGVASGVTNFLIVDMLDEGLGAGIVTHGELMHGAQALSGEIGHMTLNPVDGPLCICGSRGCFEAMVSMKRIRQLARSARERGVSSLLFSRAPDDQFALDDLCDLAAARDALCLELLDDVARWFVVGLGNVMMVNDPELVVIQGPVVRTGDLFLGRLREGIRQIGLPDVTKRVRIEYSRLGEERGVLGGAAFALGEFFSRRLRL
ncbi:MAG TPA: ROK family transcriptional regulator [Anaeromyxobacter sp.]|nr:ROK family transcriptional regulator [Anaeromyxobacter sp.]